MTKGQLDYELALLKQKLKRRCIEQYERINSISNAEPNPLFEVVEGQIEAWERVKNLMIALDISYDNKDERYKQQHPCMVCLWRKL